MKKQLDRCKSDYDLYFRHTDLLMTPSMTFTYRAAGRSHTTEAIYLMCILIIHVSKLSDYSRYCSQVLDDGADSADNKLNINKSRTRCLCTNDQSMELASNWKSEKMPLLRKHQTPIESWYTIAVKIWYESFKKMHTR